MLQIIIRIKYLIIISNIVILKKPGPRWGSDPPAPHITTTGHYAPVGRSLRENP